MIIFKQSYRTCAKFEKDNCKIEVIPSWDLKTEAKGKMTLGQIVYRKYKNNESYEGFYCNGFYFRMKDGENYTDMIVDGKIIHNKHSYGSYGICMLPDGTIKLDHFNKKYKYFIGGIKAMHGGVRPTWIGTDKLYYSGVPTSNSHKRQPNIAIGMNSKGEMCVVAFDGRRWFLRGCTFDELVKFMRDIMDCQDVMILDGGGSVQLAYVSVNMEITYLNNPSEHRAVANWIYIQQKEYSYYDVRSMPTLRKGMRKNEHVKLLQAQLNNLGYTYEGKPLKVDGWFGTKTKSVLLDYQSDVRTGKVIGKFLVDGVDGQQTKAERFFV